ncbi:hypothetical protein VUR80DRAFT_912 [Thermomyces stellatus]
MPQEPRFNECDVQSALRDVSMGTSVYTAAKRWRIPKSTLLYRTRGSTDRATVGAARRKISKARDNHLARWVRVLAMNGSPEPLGMHWVTSFLKRYPEITKVNGLLYETSTAPRPVATGSQTQQQQTPIAEQHPVIEPTMDGEQASVGQQVTVGEQTAAEQQTLKE